MLAAIEVIRHRDPGEWTRAALAYNPRYGEIFQMLAYFEQNRRRYVETDAWLAQAVKVQPDLWSARTQYAVNLMRLGKIEEARPHLVAVYEATQPFTDNVTVNTLRLLDSLEKFDMVKATSPDMHLQLAKTETASLGPYVEKITRDAINIFARKYGDQPTAPITVEMYPNSADFAVRVAGLPGIGLLGVTFGHLVAMDSPSGRQTGDFHWGSVLWHELAHVFSVSGLTQFVESDRGLVQSLGVGVRLLHKEQGDAQIAILEGITCATRFFENVSACHKRLCRNRTRG
jgi:hypothetical protein